MNPIGVVDPNGKAAMVFKQGNNVSVLVPAIFSGNAATPENIALVQNTVASKLNGKHGQYNLTVRVVALPEGANGEDFTGINKINLLNNNGPCTRESCVRRNVDNPATEATAFINMEVPHFLYDMVHEIAHLLGIEDQYGLDGNLMGEKDKFELTSQQVEEMWDPNSDFGAKANAVYETK